MDLGCLDLGCIDKQTNDQKKFRDVQEPLMTTSKFAKTKISKETGLSPLNAVNRSTSQIRKSYRKTSPMNWFPRKKTESYLKRKIRLLQEVGGMSSTLDETLGDSNPHYSRVLKEKMAAREAACKAMEARKAALVEASWCRILRAARIQSKEAESLLLKAEKNVEEAFEAAAAMGVIMYDRPDCPQKACEIESSNIGGSTTHKVTASFETAFDVDKEVAGAVKTACIRLANCSSTVNKDDFRDLLRRISQNPDTSEVDKEIYPECEIDTGPKRESETQEVGSASQGLEKMLDSGFVERKCSERDTPDAKSINLVDMMLERLKGLQDDELASLATIVATCGLNAALLEVGNSKEPGSDYSLAPSLEAGTAKYSNVESFKDRHMRKQVMTELPSLDKLLVKHMSKLEREVQKARNTRKTEAGEGYGENTKDCENRVDNSSSSATSAEVVPDLGSDLIKHASKLEREIEEAKRKSGTTFQNKSKQLKNTESEVPSLDKFLVKHVSRLEREVQEAKKKAINNPSQDSLDRRIHGNSRVTSSEAVPDLGSIFVKHSSKLEKEIEETKSKSGEEFEKVYMKLNDKKHVQEVPSLDKFLVKHVSKLEREVQEAKSAIKSKENDNMASSRDNENSTDLVKSSFIDEKKQVGKENIDSNKQGKEAPIITAKEALKMETVENEIKKTVLQQENFMEHSEPTTMIKNMSRIEKAKLENLEAFSSQDGKKTSGSLDKVLVKPVHRLEREKMNASETYGCLESQKNRKKKGGTDASDMESLDKVLIKHVSGLEKEKIEHSEKEEGIRVGRRYPRDEKNMDGGLDQILVKHQSRLEREKLAAQNSEDWTNQSLTRRETKQRELQEAWGGMSLGNSIRPHVSRLEREKLASRLSENQSDNHTETRRQTKQRELEEAWGGLSLGNTVCPHVSRLEREKAAWIKAEEEEQTQAHQL